MEHEDWMNTARNRSTVPRSENRGQEIMLPPYHHIWTLESALSNLSIPLAIHRESDGFSFSIEDPHLGQVTLNEHSPDSSKVLFQLAFDLRTKIPKKTRN